MSEKKELKRVKQITGSYCGPAVFEMLVSHLGLNLNQEALVDACEVRNKISKLGVSLTELAIGLEKLVPNLRVWRKADSSIQDIQSLLEKGYYVGFDWQGIFNSDEYGDEIWNSRDRFNYWWKKTTKQPLAVGDQGHYAIALEVDSKKGYLRFADPYGHYAGRDRFVAIWEFEERWWDDMVERDDQGKNVYVVEERLMFVVAPKKDTSLQELGMSLVVTKNK